MWFLIEKHSKLVLFQKYMSVKSHINHAIADVSSYALTTDIWSSRAMHSYMGPTIHFIDANFCLHSYLLDVNSY